MANNAFALDLSSAIASSSNRVQSGVGVTYTGTVINNSSTLATNSQLIFYMPPRNVNYISLPVGCTIKVKITCLLGDIAGGASVNKSITVSYSSAGSAIVSALAFIDSADGNTSNNLSRLTTNVTKSISNSVTIPSISSVTPNPVSVTLGNSINFSATLSGTLPNGYSVKLNYSNSSISMNGSNTSYSLVQTPTQLGQQVFTIGIYDANNILKSNTLTGNFEIVKGNSAPTLSLISGDASATLGTNYSVQLQASDVDNNLKSINVDWGDGKSDLQSATNGTTITFTHTYLISGTYKLISTSIDADLINSISVSKVLIISEQNNLPNTGTGKLNDTGITNCANEINHSLKCPVAGYENQDAESGLDKSGHTGFNFTRISLNSGHQCVQDNITGLMWEVKVNDSSSLYNYTWYETDTLKNGGGIGKENGGICSLDKCDTSNYIKKLNEIGYCGYKDWRLPTYSELLSIVNFNKNTPSIDTEYFSYTKGIKNYYWTASPISQQIDLVWIIDFNSGEVLSARKSEKLYVRLVRG